VAFEIVKDIAHVRAAVGAVRKAGKAIGYVPTMGALHAGHASLLNAARRECAYVVASIFVNPKQFGPNEDFTRYPRTWEADVALCQSEGVDLLFAPPVEAVYPPGFRTQVEVTGLQDVLDGQSRPGHFRGVATVVLKLFNIVQPGFAYFGQKDAQQVCIIQKMMRDLELPITLRICPTVREPDGLALSSRNAYLSPSERRQATCLYRALARAAEMLADGVRDATKLIVALRSVIEAEADARVDYVALADPETLEPVAEVRRPMLALVAVKIGSTRLIDNLLLHPDS
jgi:pantoate--beta-alanine ligase